MDSSKISAFFLICLVFISTSSPILACPYCGTPSPVPKPNPPSTTVPPVTVPVPGVPIPIPPVVIPPPGLPLPPVGGLPIPPVGGLPIPPVGGLPIPPVGGLPIPPVGGLPIPPVGGLPPVPIVNPPSTGGAPCPPGTPTPVVQPKCPINVLKLFACADVLGGAVHAVIGGSIKHKCCPVVKGLADLEAAACLCTVLKVKALDIKILAPIALKVLVTCGKHPPPGFDCPF